MDWIEEVLNYNISPILERFGAGSFARRLSIPMTLLFPNDGKVCACGCGVELTGRKTRWASTACQIIPVKIQSILTGDSAVIYNVISRRDGERCNICHKTAEDLWEEDYKLSPKERWNKSPLEVEHVLPVFKKGGCRWLDNYQLLCRVCHKIKTKADRAAAP